MQPFTALQKLCFESHGRMSISVHPKRTLCWTERQGDSGSSSKADSTDWLRLLLLLRLGCCWVPYAGTALL